MPAGPSNLPPEVEPDEEMPLYKPVSGNPYDRTGSPAGAQEAQDGDEPLLPLDMPDPAQQLSASAQKVLKALPDPSGKDVIVKWAARIEVLQAYRFDGILHRAPLWVDRNWLSWDDGGGISGQANDRTAGPALNVTRPDGSHVGMVRMGDYVVRQNTTVDDQESPDGLRVLPDHLAVVSAGEFERLFRPVVAKSGGEPVLPVDVSAKTQAA